MELQLKNVKFSEHLSEETNAFTADVFFRGKKVGYAKNDGHGGSTFTQAYPEMRNQLAEAEAYAKTLPSIDTGLTKGIGGEPFIIDSDLEVQVDKLFEAWLDQKEITKNSNKGIFYEMPNGQRSTMYWKGWTINKLKGHPQGSTFIQDGLDKVIAKGGKVLNTNLQGFKF